MIGLKRPGESIVSVMGLLLSMMLVGCGKITEPHVAEAQEPEKPALIEAQSALSPTLTPSQNPVSIPVTTANPSTITLMMEPLEDPFLPITIDALSARSYGGSGIILGDLAKSEPGFLQYAMHYESDGLRITGLINIPVGEGPFPVVIINHGYMTPQEYQSGFDSWRIAEWMVKRGYIAIMPDYRNYAGSSNGPNPFRIGYAIDILNLIPQVRSLPQAVPGQVGIIGHSLGGEIGLWPMVISDEVDAIIFYAPMSGNVARNWEHRWRHWPTHRNAMEATALIYGYPADNPEGYASISPENYFNRARMPVQIHHGNMDESVPYWWSEDMADKMSAAGVDVTFVGYGGESHGFTNRGFDAMLNQALALFEITVKQDTNHPSEGTDSLP